MIHNYLSPEEIYTGPEDSKDTIEMDIDVKIGVKKEEGDDIMEMDESEPIGEPEDEVVQEIDVWFSPSTDRTAQVRVKSATAEVEVDLAVDVDSRNYNSRNDLSEQSKTQTLTSIWKPTHTSDYAIGVLTGNKLSLHPIHAVVQLCPSMQYLDSRESKRRSGVSSNVEDAVKSEP